MVPTFIYNNAWQLAGGGGGGGGGSAGSNVTVGDAAPATPHTAGDLVVFRGRTSIRLLY